MTNQQKLYILMQENNLQLSLSDLLQFLYHEWDYNYLTVEKAAEHMADSMNQEYDSDVIYSLLNSSISLGRLLADDSKGMK